MSFREISKCGKEVGSGRNTGEISAWASSGRYILSLLGLVDEVQVPHREMGLTGAEPRRENREISGCLPGRATVRIFPLAARLT
jgi:hypothetical protein